MTINAHGLTTSEYKEHKARRQKIGKLSKKSANENKKVNLWI